MKPEYFKIFISLFQQHAQEQDTYEKTYEE